MPGSIQSIERAAAFLRLLGSTDRSLGLAELADALDLPRPTAHGILRTLRDVGFVEQDHGSARYRLGSALADLGRGGLDPYDLRAAAMNWADALAGSTGLAVELGVSAGRAVRVVHHVFRPDGSPQRLRTGMELPLHATALGKGLLAFAPVATPRPRTLDLHPWTGRTCTSVAALAEHLAVARRRGWASDVGEHEAESGTAAAPIRGSGGIVVGMLGIVGPVEELFTPTGALRDVPARELMGVSRELSATMGATS